MNEVLMKEKIVNLLSERGQLARVNLKGVDRFAGGPPALLLLLSWLSLCLAAPVPTNHLENLTLDQALEMAERLQPQLAEAKAMVEAAEGRARQAGRFPNPEAIVGAQQIPFHSGAPNEKEFVAGLRQTIPFSRRLSKAREAGLLDRSPRSRV